MRSFEIKAFTDNKNIQKVNLKLLILMILEIVKKTASKFQAYQLEKQHYQSEVQSYYLFLICIFPAPSDEVNSYLNYKILFSYPFLMIISKKQCYKIDIQELSSSENKIGIEKSFSVLLIINLILQQILNLMEKQEQKKMIKAKQQVQILKSCLQIVDRYERIMLQQNQKTLHSQEEDFETGGVRGILQYYVLCLDFKHYQSWYTEIIDVIEKFSQFQKISVEATKILEYLENQLRIYCFITMEQKQFKRFRRVIQRLVEILSENIDEIETQSILSTEGERLNMEMYSCPLTLEIMKEPADLPCGHCFEEQAIKNWLAKNQICPMCKEKFNFRDIRKNKVAKDSIAYFLKRLQRKYHKQR